MIRLEKMYAKVLVGATLDERGDAWQRFWCLVCGVRCATQSLSLAGVASMPAEEHGKYMSSCSHHHTRQWYDTRKQPPQ